MDEKPLLLKPDGTVLESPAPVPRAHLGTNSGNAQLSPDGERMAFMLSGEAYKQPPGAVPNGLPSLIHSTTLRVLELGGEKASKSLDTVHVDGFHWLDRKTLYVRGQEIGDGGVAGAALESWAYDPATGGRKPLKVPADFVVRAVGPDGKTTVADEWKMAPAVWHQHAHLWVIGTDTTTPLLGLNQAADSPTPKFSPDGKTLLCRILHYGSHTSLGNNRFDLGDFKSNAVVAIDLGTKKRTVVKDLGEKPEWGLAGLSWSPDGKRIGFVEGRRTPPVPGARAVGREYRVTVADADGRNAKEVYTAEGSWLVGFDWK